MSMRVFSVFKIAFKSFRATTIDIGNIRHLTKEKYGFPRETKFQRRQKKLEYVSNKLLHYEADGFFPWEKIKSDILDGWSESVSNINSMIFNGCQFGKKPEIALSFYKYLLEQREKPTPIDNYLFLLNLKNYPQVIRANKDLLIELYRDIESDLELHTSLREVANNVFSYIDECWPNVFKGTGSSEDVTTSSPPTALQVAFDSDKLDLAWQGLSVNNFNKVTMSSYMKYCLRKAEAGEFNPSLLDRVTTFCRNNFRTFPNFSNFPKLLQDVVRAANNNPNGKLNWTANPCSININNVCSNCCHELKELKMTADEWKELKSHYLEQVIVNHNVHIKSSEWELKRFLSMLAMVKNYNVVIDGLNAKSGNGIIKAIEFFKQKNMDAFIIGRHYSLKDKSFKEALNQSVGYFLVDNLSDDDVFTMYAAISRGPNTYVYTSDYYRGYANSFKDAKLRTLFVKWQLLHQYRNVNNQIVKPQAHGMIPQKTIGYNHDQKYVYHISYSNVMLPRLANTTSWICVQGEPR